MARRARRAPYRYRRETHLMKYTFGSWIKETISVRVARARKVVPVCQTVVRSCSDRVR